MNKQLDEIDKQAEREGAAIRQHNKFRPKNHKIRKLYFVDNEPFITGNKRRSVIQHAGG